MPDNLHFYSHGKLLLSGEYFVLNGAKALATPTRFGQHLEVRSASGRDGLLFWKSLDEKGHPFLTVTFELDDFKILERQGEVPHYLLQDALRGARNLQKDFINHKANLEVTSRLEFSMGWGLGSSSTLIYNIASWAKADVFDLYFSLLKGSGYDIASAGAKKPIVYQLRNNHAVWNEIDFHPAFADHLLFVYLGKKQNSQQAVRQYLNNVYPTELSDQITALTEKMISAGKIDDFIALMKEHEAVLSSALRLEMVQTLYFADFPGAVKSLGAWGGDFVMACSAENPAEIKKYFSRKGFQTLFKFSEIALIS
ncbi:MAG TPA: GYDIA family GHMP kinase [Chitinophagales bacterium]|nr:GYDIA family GHMP kinase [Chitinophagales bacterium]